MKFRLANGEKVRTVKCAIASATVIAAGDLVTMTTGLIVKAAAASTAIGWCPDGSASGETICEVTVGNDFTLKGTGDAVFAASYKGTEVDITDTNQYIDVGASATDVLKVDISEKAGVVGSANDISVRINKPLF